LELARQFLVDPQPVTQLTAREKAADRAPTFAHDGVSSAHEFAEDRDRSS
jgi:hypothetical protein